MYAFDHLLSNDIFELSGFVPSVCADKFINNEVDLSLLPVGVLHELSDFSMMDNYCLSCDGEVRTVCIFSDSPIDRLKFIRFDEDSRTSNLLAQILVDEYWGLDLDFGYSISDSQEQVGYVLIGDKVFEQEHDYQFKYDLGEIWKMHTGLPFVFAVWVYQMQTSKKQLNLIEAAFDEAFRHQDIWLEEYKNSKHDLFNYLTKNIRFHFNNRAKESLQLFRNKIKSFI